LNGTKGYVGEREIEKSMRIIRKRRKREIKRSRRKKEASRNT
jgi:hypothetical protein